MLRYPQISWPSSSQGKDSMRHSKAARISYTPTKQQQHQLTSEVGLDVGDTEGSLLGLWEGDFDGLLDGYVRRE